MKSVLYLMLVVYTPEVNSSPLEKCWKTILSFQNSTFGRGAVNLTGSKHTNRVK